MKHACMDIITTPTHKFVLPLSYWTMSINSLSSVVAILKELHAPILDPYTCLAELRGLLSTINMTKLHDIPHFIHKGSA